MTSDTGPKLAFSSKELTLSAIKETVRRLRPGLSEGQYIHVTNGVYALVCKDPKMDMPFAPSEIPTTDELLEDRVTQEISSYLTMFEISIGQQVLYTNGYEF